jgi:dihydroflavonol-4-reductase
MAGRVVVVGGTGFLGYHAALELVGRGFSVTALGHKDFPESCPRPAGVAVVIANLHTEPNERLATLLAGYDAVVFAAGADERAHPRTSALEFFRYANVETTERVLRFAKEGGARRAVVLGSYFAHFAEAWPELRLADRHPYIRSRLEQQEAAARSGLSAVVLQLPYIFGSAPGQTPLWAPLVRYLKGAPLVLYPKGGSNAVAVRHVAEAIAGGVERSAEGPVLVGDENLTWVALVGQLLDALGRHKSVLSLPTALLYPSGLAWRGVLKLKGETSGLDPLHFVTVQTREAFFDPAPGRRALGHTGGGLATAIVDTVKASLG